MARGVGYLRSVAGQQQVGEAALVALTLKKALVKEEDPAIQTCLAKILPCFTAEGYTPNRRGGHDNYEAAVVCLALANINPVRFKPQVEMVAKYLIAAQKGSGAWDYIDRTAGDTSMTQYALLALWEAENMGVDVPPRLWDSAAGWFIRTQESEGGWRYHPDEPQWPQTVSMTAAGVGSILICKQQLARYREGPEVAHPLLIPLTVEGAAPLGYKVATSVGVMNAAARRGTEWLARNYQVVDNDNMGLTVYYGLYGIERTAALANADSPNKKRDAMGFDWYGPGLRFTLGAQAGNGSWDGRQYGPAVNTCWAILFASKATANSVRIIEIRRLGAGTLRGGRGLPSDLDNLVIGADGRVMVKPMNGAIEGMLAVLEDPNAGNADAALAGLIDQYQKRGPTALRPFKDRFRKLAEDRDAGLRRVAVWALGRMAELDVVPTLVRSLLDPVDEVVAEARVGLQVISRKLSSLGPDRGATAEQKLESAKRWREWYEQVRPPELEPLDMVTLKPRFRAPVEPPAGEGSEEGSQ